MCLDIRVNVTKDAAKGGKVRFRKNKDGMLIGYKCIMSLTKASPFSASWEQEGRNWKVGVMQSSRTSVALTEHETLDELIDKGYHLAAVAGKIQSYMWAGTETIRVLVDPKDVVATGAFDGQLALVCTKCLVESMTPVTTYDRECGREKAKKQAVE